MITDLTGSIGWGVLCHSQASRTHLQNLVFVFVGREWSSVSSTGFSEKIILNLPDSRAFANFNLTRDLTEQKLEQPGLGGPAWASNAQPKMSLLLCLLRTSGGKFPWMSLQRLEREKENIKRFMATFQAFSVIAYA